MRATRNTPLELKSPPVGKNEPKNYASPDTLFHTFETLSNLHKLLPNRMMEMLHSYKSEEEKRKCESAELSCIERILERHHLPPEISLSPKPSLMPSWKRKSINNVSDNWKKCYLWKRNTKDPPMCTVVVR
ncbi:testis expressed protein 56-like [Ctenodactylus gundi]